MPRRGPSAVLLTAALVPFAGCGGGGGSTASPDASASAAAATATAAAGVPAQPAPSAVAAALAATAAVPAAERRLAYVNLKRVDELEPLGGAALVRRVLGRAPSSGDTAVRVGNALTVRSSAAQPGAAAPRENVIAAETPSAVQSCLGDAAAETIVGPRRLGHMSAIGASVRRTDDGVLTLAVCAAPHRRRDLYRIQRRIERLLPRARVGEAEIGERDIVAAEVPVAHVRRALVRALVAGEGRLLALAGR